MIVRLTQGPWDYLTASLQADVGAFLQTRQRLLTWQTVAAATAQPAIADLLAQESTLEEQLGAAQAASQRLQSGSLGVETAVDTATVGAFVYRLEAYLARVNELASTLGQAGVAVSATASVPSWPMLIGWGLLGIGTLWLLRMVSRR